MPELTAAEPKSREQIEHERDIDRRLRVVFATALRHAHDGGRVEVHVGSDVVAYLKSLAIKVEDAGFRVAPMLWGYPLIESTAAPDHISVHVVHHIA